MPANELKLQSGRTYRGKRPRNAMGLVNDRTILHIGATVCIAAGLAVAGLVISMASSYMWRSTKAAYGLGYLRYTAKAIHRRTMIRTAARRADKNSEDE